MVATRFENGRHEPLSADGADHWHFVPQRVDPRQRRQIRFWVDVRHEIGEWAIETMDALKAERKFKETMLNGFRLVIELKAKKLDFLFEIAPWLEGWMDSEIEREVSRRVALAVKEQTAGQGELATRLAALEAKLAALDTPAPGPRPLKSAQDGSVVLFQKVSLPADDDDGALLSIKKAAPGEGTASAKSFLDSAFSLQSGL